MSNAYHLLILPSRATEKKTAIPRVQEMTEALKKWTINNRVLCVIAVKTNPPK